MNDAAGYSHAAYVVVAAMYAAYVASLLVRSSRVKHRLRSLRSGPGGPIA